MKAVPNYNGIGMGVFSPFAAVNIDDCVKDGKLSELAEDAIHLLIPIRNTARRERASALF